MCGVDQRKICNPLHGCLIQCLQSVLCFLVVTCRENVACKVIIQTIKLASFVFLTQQGDMMCLCVYLYSPAFCNGCLWVFFIHLASMLQYVVKASMYVFKKSRRFEFGHKNLILMNAIWQDLSVLTLEPFMLHFNKRLLRRLLKPTLLKTEQSNQMVNIFLFGDWWHCPSTHKMFSVLF